MFNKIFNNLKIKVKKTAIQFDFKKRQKIKFFPSLQELESRFVLDGTFNYTMIPGQLHAEANNNGLQYGRDIGIDQAGNTTVVWTDGGTWVDGHDGSSFGVYARRFDPQGKPLGDQFRVNDITEGSQTDPSLGIDGQGRAVVAYASGSFNFNALYNNFNYYEIRVQRLNLDGTRGETIVVPTTPNAVENSNPKIIVNKDGSFELAFWDGDSYQLNGSVRLLKYNKNNELVSSFSVHTGIENASDEYGWFHVQSSVAMGEDGSVIFLDASASKSNDPDKYNMTRGRIQIIKMAPDGNVLKQIVYDSGWEDENSTSEYKKYVNGNFNRYIVSPTVDGGYIWSTRRADDSTGSGTILVEKRSADGKIVRPLSPLVASGRYNMLLSISPLPDGKELAIYSEYSPNNDATIKGTILEKDGTPKDDPFFMVNTRYGDSISVAVGPGGKKLAATWNDEYSPNADLSKNGVPLVYFDKTIPLKITSGDQISLDYGKNINHQITVTGGVSPTFSAVDLPQGITLDSKTGVLSGMASAGSYQIQVTVTEAGRSPATQDIFLDINKVSLVITPNSLKKIIGGTVSFNGDEFSSVGLIGASDKITRVVLESGGSLKSAPIGVYDIVIKKVYGNGLENYSIVLNTGKLKVSAVNSPPGGTDKTITINEDQVYKFSVNDFGFIDNTNNDQFSSLKISTLPAKGILRNNGVDITSKNILNEITAENIKNGLLTYTPALNESGLKYSSFTFQVRDDGGTAENGKDLDPTPNTVQFQVNSVNDAPVGVPRAATAVEDLPYKFAVTDFAFSDPEKYPLLAVKITNIPDATQGELKLNGLAVNSNQEILESDISKGKFTFTPVKDGNGLALATWKFQVRDKGGVANGGIDLDPTPRLFTFNVNNVNDPPIGVDAKVSINEDSTFKILPANFLFKDVEKNDILKIKIAALPVASKGTLKLNGIPVVLNQEIAIGDIKKEGFTFQPAKDASGKDFAFFKFQIRDNGGASNGGSDLDPVARLFSFDVNPVNDAPVLTAVNTIVGAKINIPLELTFEALAAQANEKDVDGDILSFRIQTIPTGKLEKFDGNNWVSVVPGKTLVAPKEKIRWTPSVSGTALSAFTIVAWDGSLASGQNILVKITASK